jgi:predicted nucleotidyltransferase
VQNDSSTSVVIKSANPDLIRKAVPALAQSLREKYPEIRSIIWFGSWVNGIPVPGSDVDLCLILSQSELRPRERIPRYLPSGFPVGLDLFPYTEAEFAALAEHNSSWYRCIMTGKDI